MPIRFILILTLVETCRNSWTGSAWFWKSSHTSSLDCSTVCFSFLYAHVIVKNRIKLSFFPEKWVLTLLKWAVAFTNSITGWDSRAISYRHPKLLHRTIHRDISNRFGISVSTGLSDQKKFVARTMYAANDPDRWIELLCGLNENSVHRIVSKLIQIL